MSIKLFQFEDVFYIGARAPALSSLSASFKYHNDALIFLLSYKLSICVSQVFHDTVFFGCFFVVNIPVLIICSIMKHIRCQDNNNVSDDDKSFLIHHEFIDRPTSVFCPLKFLKIQGEAKDTNYRDNLLKF